MTPKQKQILKSFADNDMNIARVTRQLNCKRGSVAYHFEQIKNRTGLDPRKFYDLMKLIQKIGG